MNYFKFNEQKSEYPDRIRDGELADMPDAKGVER
jgi:hypothetical protein